ncbi:MAG: thiolase family protein [Deltaproteobacteria bacterium]|nr:thiolase family protein [Deltaproteobacteria bacterium]
MEQEVAIVDAVQTRHGSALKENIREIMFSTVRQLLNRVGIEKSEIGTMVSSSSDYWQGISCSNSYYYDAAGANLKSGSKAAEDSALGFHYGAMRILSGHYKTVLVTSITKCSEAPPVDTLTHLATDPFFQRPVGLNETISTALQAKAYLHRFELNEEDLAGVPIKNLANAQNNPNAHRKGVLSLDDVLASPTMASPLREIDVPNTSDGACAILLATKEVAKDLTKRPVFVQGLGWNVSETFLGDRDLLNGSLPKAAKMAYKMANIEKPLDDIDVAEICDTTSFNEILWTEQLGFCAPGKGTDLLKDGITSMGGALPVNPSGGLFGANPYVARGLIRIAEIALQLKGEGEKRQVPDAKRGLAHSVHGLGGQLHSVVVLGV